MASLHEIAHAAPRLAWRPVLPAGWTAGGVQIATVLRLMPRATAIAVGVVAWVVWLGGGSPVDAIAYWTVDPLDPYHLRSTTEYVYTPAFAQAIAPLLGLPFDAFVAAIRGLELVALYALVGPLLPLVLLLSPVASDISAGNVNIALTAAAWYGLRRPGLWAFALLTKLTPGIGVLWFAFRREWRSFGIALGVTVAIVTLSFAIAPAAWFDYPGFLVAFDPVAPSAVAVRLPIAVVLLWWGARSGRAWVIPLVVLLALPRLTMISPCVLVPLANRAAWRRVPRRPRGNPDNELPHPPNSAAYTARRG